MSALLKPKERRLDLARRNTPSDVDSQGSGYYNLIHRCAVGRDPPLTPQAMSKIVRHEKKFTGSADCEIVDDMYGDFFDAVAPAVTELKLDSLGWGAAEGTTLAEGLPRFTNCRTLGLYSNPLGDAAGKAISEAVGAMPSLQELGMDSCGFGEEAAASLAGAIQQSTTLTTVCLRGNDAIGDAGALALAEAIGGNTTLRKLELFRCGLGEDAKAALREAASTRVDNPLKLLM